MHICQVGTPAAVTAAPPTPTIVIYIANNIFNKQKMSCKFTKYGKNSTHTNNQAYRQNVQ